MNSPVSTQEADRFSLHSDRYSPSFYHFKPNKTVLHPHHNANHNNGSIYKEAIPPDTPFYRPAPAAPAGGAAAAAAGNSYTGKDGHKI